MEGVDRPMPRRSETNGAFTTAKSVSIPGKESCALRWMIGCVSWMGWIDAFIADFFNPRMLSGSDKPLRSASQKPTFQNSNDALLLAGLLAIDPYVCIGNDFSPLVSVLLPAFNAASTILPAIRSILDGDYPNLECIVVDDGSEDDTFRAAKSIQDSRLRIIQQAHQGVAHAHNRAVREARGTWLARMDADDIATPNRLSTQWRFLQEQGCGLIGGGVSIVDMEGTPVKSMKRYQDWLNHLNDHAAIMAQRFVELPIVNPTLFGHRKWFERGCVQGPLPRRLRLFLNVAQDPHSKPVKLPKPFCSGAIIPNVPPVPISAMRSLPLTHANDTIFSVDL